ncbi:SusC/RagA family TonB-linked outer membrane protein [Roseisolibacter sp. H3M3-2]|uniref:SusC/RagA family TonB-linked outer membrane protein n=1 Tax=Roseisolibacter sp. H3M3-2 TaxID=3031323 RepID=UPI0023DC0ADB|nr:SusC/RagA family TonB-linked outer membrane protein [Roseisolibacter sp. H3M3-2]MDF1504175.1 SusC/RagA family TonB-linked outer membrane protein [Roseisolibacter sp. H3M3-2]
MTHIPRLLPLAVVAIVAPAAGAQQPAATGTITGTVTEQGSNAPLAAVQVQVVGTTRGAITNDAGVYRILGVAPGAVQVRVRRLGYEPATQGVTVAAGATATANFAIGRAAATTLEQVVVTATGEGQRVREQGNAVARVELTPDRVPALPAFSQALSAQAAGVQVLQSSGTAGTGSRIRIRGANSLSLSNEPLIIIDGVRVQGGGNSNSIAVGGQAPSRLDDLNPEEIESIEVLKGPAASGLYGTQAANGVVQITTKRGRAGRTNYTVYGERGLTQEVSNFPPNYGAFGDYDGETDFFCDLPSVAGGLCTQTEIVSFNPLKDSRTTPFRDGARTQLGANVAGGTERVGYFLSGETDREAGVYYTNSVNRTSLRANLRAFVSEKADVNVSTGYVANNIQLPGNDNTFLGYISNGLAGFAQIDNPGSVNGDGYDPLGPASLDYYQNFQQARRFTGSLQANYRPLSWLRFNGVAGIDQTNRLDTQQIPPGRIELDTETSEGYRFANRLQAGTYTAQATATAQFAPTENLSSTTTASFQYQQDRNDGVFGGGYRLVAGTSSLGGAVTRFETDEAYGDGRLLGGILSQQIGWRDRLFVSAGVRGDNSSAFGENFGTVFYPTAQASWVASEEEWFPRGPLGLVRFRGSFGRSGLRPGNVDALTYFNPVPSRVNGAELAAVSVGGVGDPDLKPEVTTEFEGGVDFEAFSRRATLQLTAYNRQSKDALVARVIAPSVGVVRTRFENIGEIRNRGFEALMTLRPLDTRAVGLDLTFNYSYNTNKILTLRDTTPILITANGSQQHAQGFPAGGYWGSPITNVITNAQGIVEDVEFGEEPQFLGYSQPRTLFSFNPQLSLFNNAVRVGALVDYRGGYKQYNSSEDFRCGITATCKGIIDPSSSQEEQARAVAAYNYGNYAGFIEKADFVRFREVTLTFALPERLSQRYLKTRGVGLTLAGYNLGIITDYTGVDPEVNASAQSNFIQSDFLSQAPVRRFSARVNVNF